MTADDDCAVHAVLAPKKEEKGCLVLYQSRFLTQAGLFPQACQLCSSADDAHTSTQADGLLGQADRHNAAVRADQGRWRCTPPFASDTPFNALPASLLPASPPT